MDISIDEKFIVTQAGTISTDTNRFGNAVASLISKFTESGYTLASMSPVTQSLKISTIGKAKEEEKSTSKIILTQSFIFKKDISFLSSLKPGDILYFNASYFNASKSYMYLCRKDNIYLLYDFENEDTHELYLRDLANSKIIGKYNGNSVCITRDCCQEILNFLERKMPSILVTRSDIITPLESHDSYLSEYMAMKKYLEVNNADKKED